MFKKLKTILLIRLKKKLLEDLMVIFSIASSGSGSGITVGRLTVIHVDLIKS